MAASMRVVVTGADNVYGSAIVDALLAAGHQVRVFGMATGPWDGVQYHPGHLATLGSIEPVLAEREALVHAAPMAEPGKDALAHATMVQRSTLGCRYGAERELLDQFVLLTPAAPGRKFAKAHEAAIATATSAHKVQVDVVHADDPATAATHVMSCLQAADHPGRYPGRENDALAA